MIAHQGPYTFVLPLVYKPEDPHRFRLGVHIEGNPAVQVDFLHPDAVVRRWLNWDECQLYENVHCWIEDGKMFWLKPYDTILCVKNTPQWARLEPDNLGSPPRREHFEDYAAILCDLADRYQPYALELFNEPEGPGADDKLISNFGDGERAGEYYGDLVSAVYPIVKAQFPNVFIFAGSLHQDTSDDFLKGFLDHAGGCFDVLSIHGYVYSASQFDTPLRMANKMRCMVDKPIWLTETSLLYDIRTDAKDQEQGEYLAYLLEHAQDYGIVGVSWYPLTSNNWRNSDMMWGSAPKPAYNVWRAWLERRSI